MVLMSLQVLQVVKTVLRLHHKCKLVVAILIEEVRLTATQDVVYAFEGYCQHFYILHFED